MFTRAWNEIRKDMEDYKNKVIEYIKLKYDIDPEYPFASDREICAFYDKETNKWFGLIMQIPKTKLGMSGDGEIVIMNVKADPDFIAFLANKEGYRPAYHMNKRNWISLRLDKSLNFEEIILRIDESFALVNHTPSKRIYEAVKRIPYGRVASYKQVAAMAGNEKMSRAVGNALHKNPDPENIPCFRVVNSRGELSGEFAFGGKDEQAKLLRAEGVEVVDGRVDLERFGVKV